MTFHFRQGIKNIPEICACYGIQKAVIAPGSRNAPLIFAFTQQPQIECLSITDERSAAYFALGIAQQSGRPVALVCTSGTAALNFAPAIAEAYYQNLPLIVFTADRPAEMIDQADGQTLKQNNIFENYIKASFTTPVETVSPVDLQFSDRLIAQAIDTATTYPQGPVHINVPLREPIYTPIPQQHTSPKIIKTLPFVTKIADETLSALQNEWTNRRAKLVVFGILPKNKALNDLAQKLAQQPDVVVVAENLSNITGENIITQPEALFSRINFKNGADEFIPDLLITVGNSVICKQLKIFLRNHPAAAQWQIQSSMPYVDTYHSLTTVLRGNADEILDKMPFDKTESNFSWVYRQEMSAVVERHQTFVENASLSDMSVTMELLKQLPHQTTLHLGNSTSVRWTQLFPTRTDITYICNRGVSGIDGSLSTAVGYAHSSGDPTALLIGDVSFIYDSNGLWNNYISNRLKIIVINNNGGNIFRFIGDKELMKHSLDFFTTPHHVKIRSLTDAYGLDYLSCDKTEELPAVLQTFFQSDKATVLEIFTDSDLNTENYQGYFKNIKR